MLFYLLLALWLLRALFRKEFRQVPAAVAGLLYFFVWELLRRPEGMPYHLALWFGEKALLLIFAAGIFLAAWKGAKNHA